MAEFRWNEWNLDHISRHAVEPEEAEWIVNHYGASDAGGDKYMVWGQTAHGRYLQVIFVLDAPDEVYVIHARDLIDREKRIFRRRRR